MHPRVRGFYKRNRVSLKTRGDSREGASWGTELLSGALNVPQPEAGCHRVTTTGTEVMCRAVCLPLRGTDRCTFASPVICRITEFVTRTFFQKRFSQKPWRSKGSAALPLHARSGLPRRLLSVRSFPRLVVSSPGVGPSGALGLQGSTVTFARFSSHWVVRLLVSPSPPEAYLLVSKQHVSDLLQMVLFHPAGW